ncbi:GntR family transcriptional regulator [Gulosibacter macacae]|uniref:GntR family transcriptional regulator n=1 Tax=Gulosibacter macacae TaxID=2488791 RepID=UPI0016396DD2|nr:GntR family transcriptional regulator [Gulosibacter macacae]
MLLHESIAERIRDEIDAERIEIGASMPTERELAEIHGASVGTVRLALRNLVLEGTLAGGRGAPKTVVRRPNAPSAFSEVLSFAQWAYAQGREPGGSVVDQVWVTANSSDVRNLRCATRDRVLLVVRTRTLDGEIVMLERARYPDWLGRIVEQMDPSLPSVTNALGEQGVHFTRADHSFAAVAASSEDSRLLCVPRGKPLLSHHRVSADRHGLPLENSEDRYLSGMLAIAVSSSEQSNPLRWVDL